MKHRRIALILTSLFLCITICVFTSCTNAENNEEDVYLFLASGSTYDIDLASTLGFSQGELSGAFVVTPEAHGGIYAQYGAVTISMPLTSSGNYFVFKDVSGTYHATHMSYTLREGVLTVTTYAAGDEVDNFLSYMNGTLPSVTLRVTDTADGMCANIHFSLVSPTSSS